ncbi:APC membrane recruitment protein 2-like [Parambassis ranga]|uniref:APC membrane recruitment protein 2-like n=1 Tax=Parambassis ranga TaxID=210632 RepID=A0A6P7JKB2_9TELE|nr:APC membrane recruitment protein 2-like [Parambassis ranga]
MDVQTDNMDPPPGESQPSGKIRKGFKLFGKRKPGNIFSIRSKGDGNNKSPVIRSNTVDGLSGTPAPDSEQEPDKEKGQEESQGEREHAEEEPLGEDGILAAAPARNSISSACSAKSLSFLSLLRGGRRGVGERRVHTVAQPVGRHRRGLKGLFGNVKFRSKEEKEETPPSPLLMSSRANSVEIIKEDLTLTPKSLPRSLDSPDTESSEPVKSLTTPDSAATSPSKTETPQVTTGNVSRTNEHVPPLPTSEPPLVPGEKSLSSLLADISSLLTFDSISGGGDIMADVEAEWGKASSGISPVAHEARSLSTSPYSKPTICPPLTSTAKPSPAAVPTTASSQSFTSTSSPISKPSAIITTLTKSSTLTTHSIKQSSDTPPASEPSTSTTVKSSYAPTAAKSSTSPVTSTSLSTPVRSEPSIKSPLSSTSTTTTAPLNSTATVVKAPSINPALAFTASKLASESAAPPQSISSVSKPLAPDSIKTPPVTHSAPLPVTITQPPSAKLDSASSLNFQTSHQPPLSSVDGAAKAPPMACSVPTKPSSPAVVTLSKMTTAPTSTSSSGPVPAAISKPTLTSTPMDLNKTPSSLITSPDLCPSSTLTVASKTQPSPASVPTPSSTSLDKIPSTTKPTSAPVCLDKMPPTPTPIPVPTTHTAASTASPPPTALAQISVSQTKPPPAQVPVESKELPALQTQSKPLPAPVQIPRSISKEPPPPPAKIEVPQSKPPPVAFQIPVSASKPPSAPTQIPVSVSMEPPAPVSAPVSVAKDLPASVHMSISQTKAPPAPTPAPCPVTPSPAPMPSEALASAKTKGLSSVDKQVVSQSSSAQGAQPSTPKTEELYSESQGPSREKRISQAKPSGLSKIPVAGGGKVTKLPVRDSQHVDDEPSRDPPTPVLEEEMPHFNSHDAGSRDKISTVEANAATSKHTQEESQQPQQPKVLTSAARDSKIPVKHGAQSHTASPQSKEPARTKIPVSKVPVRRVAKPAATGSSTQIRK